MSGPARVCPPWAVVAMRCAAAAAAGLSLIGCAARGFVPPAGPGQPFPEFAQQFEEATKTCRGVRTLTAEGSLSGRVGGQRVRGRVHLGLAESNALRLEAVAPFGPPAFILAAQDGEGTLLLPRDNAAIRRAPADALIDALAGLTLSPDDLRAVATGCVAPAASPIGGQRFGNDLAAITLKGGAVVYVSTRAGVPQVLAARRSGLFVEYGDYVNGLPRRIRIRSEAPPAAQATDGRRDDTARADLTLTLAEVDLNVQIDPAAFTIDVPPDARPLTLDELRRAGPLGKTGT
jgi:hypothetical protein